MLSMSMVLAMALMLLGLVAAVVYGKIRYKIPMRMLGLGALSFLVATQFFERILHVLVLRPDATGSSYLLRDFPFLYVLYAIVVAAIFEETARFLVLRFVQSKRQIEMKDALAYGLGHGGIEMIVVGLLSLLNLFLLYQAISQNQTQIINLLPEAAVESIRNTPIWTPYVLVVERFLALASQIMLSIWVWKAVVQKNARLFLAALAFHALIDVAPALSQVGWITSPILVEVLVLLAVLVLGYFTRKLLK